MNVKLKQIAAAVTLAAAAVAGPAHAAIGSGDNATLFLEVFDTGASGQTYIRDLGVSMLNFGTQNRPLSAGFTNIADDQASDSRTWNLTLNNGGTGADTAWQTFIGTVSGSGNLIWQVISTDSFGTSGADQRRVMYSSLTNASEAIADPGVQQTNGSITAMSAMDNWIANANALLGAGQSAISPGTGDPATYAQANMQNNLGGSLGLGVTSALLGQTMGFYYLTRSGASNGAEALAANFANGAAGAATWTLDAAGALVYTVPGVVAAVPEPETWAMFIAGLLMIGGMARRRMS